MTPSEAFVAHLCHFAFLKLWTHPSPVGKNGKELCDCLIVCGEHVIIISVKEIEYKDTGNTIGWKRWQKDAIDKSVKQIWGAERWLRAADRVLRKDGRTVELPPKNSRQIHRISVSLGGRGEVPLHWGDLGHGFVHLFDEYSVTQIFGQLNTLPDFVNYLVAVEKLFTSGVRPIFSSSGVEDLLAMYVRNGSGFGIVQADGTVPDTVVITDGIWKALTDSPEYQAEIKDLESSFSWDRLIEHFANDLLTDGIFDMHSKKVTKNQLALISMAMQPRGHRANLADAFLGFLHPDNKQVASRMVVGANETAFVFLGGDHNEREARIQELALRCHVVRARCKGVITVVGIATDRPGKGKKGHSSDIVYIYIPTLSEEYCKKVDTIQADLSYFKNMKWPS